MDRPVRVRFAPSPTGPLHLGGVRTALYNYLFAKKTKGKFILRIEDTDQNRFVPGAEEYINDTLQWTGLEPDESVEKGGPFGPYRQSDRKHLYKQYADQLVESGYAYIAFDTKEDIEEMKDRLVKEGVSSPSYNFITRQHMKNSLVLSADEVAGKLETGEHYAIRIKVPINEEIRFHDMIRGSVVFNSSQLDDKVIFKSDGMPTYHLANVVDDYLMKISHVIRGEEWLPSTPIHVLLYRYLDWENVMPEFAHLPLILKPDGNGKLSKRDGDRLGFPVFPLDWNSPETGEHSQGYRERGFLPDAFVNMLSFLGWNPGTEQELFSMDELIEAFTIEHIGKSGSKFDFEKAKWFNEQYIKKLEDNELADLLKPLVSSTFKGKDFSDDFLVSICHMMKDRISFVNEVLLKGKFFFENPEYSEENLNKVSQSITADLVQKIETTLLNIGEINAENIESSLKAFAESEGIKIGDLMKFLRISIVGELSGPSIPELIVLMGPEIITSRIKACVSKLN